MLAERLLELVAIDAFALHRPLEDLALADEQRRLALEELREALAPAAHEDQRAIRGDEDDDGHEAAPDGDVGADHGVLDRVRDHQHEHEVEHRELPHLAFAGQAQDGDEEEVDDEGADGDAEQVAGEVRQIEGRHAATIDRGRLHGDDPDATSRVAGTHPSGGAHLGLASTRLGRLATRLPITRRMVARFVAGETLEEAIAVCERLREAGMRTTVDVLGESVASSAQAEAAADRYAATLEALAMQGLDGNVSLKPSQMGMLLDAALCRTNIARVAATAQRLGAFVRVDMEDHELTEPTLALVRDLRAATPDVGVVIQSYLRRSAADVDASSPRARGCGYARALRRAGRGRVRDPGRGRRIVRGPDGAAARCGSLPRPGDP